MARVERLLAEAQERFRSGDRDSASQSLAQAALAYEAIGRMDSAATIYRSLGRGAQATQEMMTLWLGDSERRGDATETAGVAAEPGDPPPHGGREGTAEH